MSKRPLRTTDLAYAVGIHPNTVRQYEAWGWIPPAIRAPNGYRQFTEHHLHCIRLVRTCMRFTWLRGDIRNTAQSVFRSAAEQRFGSALQGAYQLLNLIRHELMQAETAARLVQRWAHGLTVDATEKPLHIGEAARQTELSTDVLRNWERDGLLKVPRNPKNGYRVYGTREISRLRIIRMLRHARYSTMAILRMLNQLDAGWRDDVRAALDVPEQGEDIHYATDRWLHTLSILEPYAQDLIAQLEWILGDKVAGVSDELGGRDLIFAFYRDVLSEILSHVDVTPENWRLAGTMANYLRGIFLPFKDIHIWVWNERQFKVWSDMLVAYPCPGDAVSTPDQSLHFVEFCVRGVTLRISTLRDVTDDPALRLFNEILWSTYDDMTCGEYHIPTAIVELIALDALTEGKPGAYQPILRYMKKHGYRHDSFVKGMKTYAIPHVIQKRVWSALDIS